MAVEQTELREGGVYLTENGAELTVWMPLSVYEDRPLAEPELADGGVEETPWYRREHTPAQVVRKGVYVDSNGRTVTVDDAMLNSLLANFEAGTAGQEVPFDIDHRREEAAGWVAYLYRDADLLYAVPRWNELGRSHVGEAIYRYLSATIVPSEAGPYLYSISLTNFPAVKGLQPLMLSESAAGLRGKEPENEVATEEGEMEREIEVQLVEFKAETLALLAALEDRMNEMLVALEQRVNELGDELRAEMGALDAKLRAEMNMPGTELTASIRGEVQVVALKELRSAWRQFRAEIHEHGAAAYLESGTAAPQGTAAGNPAVTKLPAEYAPLLRTWIAKGDTLEEWFALNQDAVGDMGQYDLSEFQSVSANP